MAKVISLDQYRRQGLSSDADYWEFVEAVVEALEEASQKATTAALNLACRGVWKDWSDAQPLGSVEAFPEEDLAKCGDDRVEMLLQVSDGLDDIVDLLQRKQQ